MKKFFKQVKRSVGIRPSRSNETLDSDEHSPLASINPQHHQQQPQQHQQETHSKYGSDQESIINHLMKRTSDATSNDLDAVDALANNNASNAPQASDQAQIRWKKIATKVDTGELLLMSQQQREREREPSILYRDRTLAQQLRSQAVEEMQSALDFSLWHCLLAVLLYVAIAVVVYSFIFENMTIIDAMYYSVVTFTTLGYGDVVPLSRAARLFTCFYSLLGVAFLGIALGILGNHVIEAERAAMDQARKLSKKRAMSLFASSPKRQHATNSDDTTANTANGGTSGTTTLERQETDEEEQLIHTGVTLSHIGLEFLAVIALLLLFSTVLADDPGIHATSWRDFGDSLYFAVITGTTIGYGDRVPSTQKGRLLATFFIPIMVAAMGHWLSLVAGYIIDIKQSRFRKEMASKELTLEDLDIMDEDGDGEVTRVEFLEFMLVAMNKVDQETLQNLRVYFRRLDTDGTGTLSKEDLIASARRKLKMTKQKLELSSYKHALLATAEGATPEKEKESNIWASIKNFNNV